MDYGKEFKKYAIKEHGINSLYYETLIGTMNPVAFTPNII